MLQTCFVNDLHWAIKPCSSVSIFNFEQVNTTWTLELILKVKLKSLTDSSIEAYRKFWLHVTNIPQMLLLKHNTYLFYMIQLIYTPGQLKWKLSNEKKRVGSAKCFWHWEKRKFTCYLALTYLFSIIFLAISKKQKKIKSKRKIQQFILTLCGLYSLICPTWVSKET